MFVSPGAVAKCCVWSGWGLWLCVGGAVQEELQLTRSLCGYNKQAVVIAEVANGLWDSQGLELEFTG